MLRVKNVFLARLDIHRKSELIAENKPQNAQRQSGRGLIQIIFMASNQYKQYLFFKFVGILFYTFLKRFPFLNSNAHSFLYRMKTKHVVNNWQWLSRHLAYYNPLTNALIRFSRVTEITGLSHIL